ncbi:MFS transporter [Rothia aerolata]|uniref:MFS transporter n=1 Tax=Rothia aerolata TaxID=1812262 RepID=A0A917IVS1_9MICC|nr:MFS transporter [Rothia aerolata]GGH66067.1 MFS transporter [Rothia aerolata]
MTPQAVSHQSPQLPQKSPKRAAFASWIGSALEYYDFAVYGTAAALVLNQIFFPEDSAAMGTLKSMLAVGVAYVVRPFGAMLMGPLGDRFGRKFVLMLTLFMMGGATFAIGLLPTYEQAGVLGTILLVICRVIQGLSASGEQASAISMSLEHSEDRSRGFTTSWTLQGTQFGSLLATAVFIPFAALPEEQLMSWGWRVPFLLSAVVVVTAYLIRRRLEEPPAFTEAIQVQKRATPLRDTFMHHTPAVVRVAACAMVNTVNMVFTTFALSYATTGMGIDRGIMLWVPVASNTLGLLAIPLMARLSDRIGRKPVFIAGAVLAGASMFPYLFMIHEQNIVGIFVVGVLMHGGFYSMANGIWPSFYAEMFPTRVRVTGMALGTQIGFAVSGGVAPVAATALAGDDLTGWFGPAVFTAAMCLVVVIAALTARETSQLSLAEIDRVQQS